MDWGLRRVWLDLGGAVSRDDAGGYPVSTIVTHICDRCKSHSHSAGDEFFQAQLHSQPQGGKLVTETFDLCFACSGELRVWLGIHYPALFISRS